mgnify:FL=1|uniref:Uncharacterized protein n=1 Tax=viral metagenome TaxID=1070528 RepID=A0A6C0F5U9_9ZZZZ|tara:strand:+ start:136 stop:1161 length:1026 start_codon:yes stop_codon:yes gene_type:complete
MCKIENCNNKGKNVYGEYCSKHKREYLTSNDLILREKFTGKSSDYLKKDIIKTLKGNIHRREWSSVKKETLFNDLINEFEILDRYQKDIGGIIRIQRYIKNKPKLIDKLRGEGFFNKKLCNNDTDFFTYDTIDEVENRYFFSYKDNNQFIWFFDIRSFNKLIELKQNNPYTREELTNESIDRSKQLSLLINLTEKDEILNITMINKTKSQIIKQKVIDLFSQIEQFGYEGNIDWFLSLNVRKLKQLYRSLEDIWNYRLQLDQDTKSRISPPNGLVFNIPVNDIQRINNRENIQEIIINEAMKFNNAISLEDKKLGYMYFLIGLGTISLQCYNAHPWMMYLN